tara:strand:+ start:13500 stop:14381 length:882 start_codon:yes stop_codon:yes gene_type:complete
MPAVGFVYPNGDKVSFEEVAKGKVDVEKMGMSIPTLMEMSKERDPNRKPSTTELLVGTCESFLKRRREYYIDPQDRAFSLAGTMHHSKLEKHEDDRLLIEEKLEEFDITGIADLYDKETKMLLDYKNTGSYKCSQLLGMTYNMLPDPSGALYKVSGKWGRKGTPKMVKSWYKDEGLAEYGDWGWQLNWYRYLLEKKGYEVDTMYIQITLRDGGLQVAQQKGLDKNIYLIPIPKYDDESLENKFLEARDSLVKALKCDNMPNKCTPKETWNGRKCEMYCEVRDLCPHNKGRVNG